MSTDTVAAPLPHSASPDPRRWQLTRTHERALIILILALFALTAGTAMRHTSVTFDEILLPAAGARGFETGDFGLVHRYHPPVLPYLYGLPVTLSGVALPVEQGNEQQRGQSFRYAREFYFSVGNDAEQIAFLARLVAVAMGTLLVLLVYLFTRSATGSGAAALLAAALTAFVPDVLAHSGISYNDVPLALVILGAVWATDAALRAPTPARAALAGLAIGLALGVKFSAIALGPVILLLLLLEALRRWPDRTWRARIARAAPIVVAAAYLALVVIYLGDFTLAEYREGLLFNIRHANSGHGAPAVLLGQRSVTGWWYFFPVAFFLKTSAGLHILMLLALATLLVTPLRAGWRELAGSSMRVPLVTGVVFLAFVMAARLNIGFRHALPLLPFVCILAAVGVARLWRARAGVLRAAIIVAAAWHIASPLLGYPFFISYLSEYTGPEENSYDVLVDSSLDWGQGLLELREFMERENVPRVLLSYFGSAPPEGYGIDYVGLPSFFGVPQQPVPPDSVPHWLAISATNLAGNYLAGDPFARFREIRPDRVLAGSIFMFRLEAE